MSANLYTWLLQGYDSLVIYANTRHCNLISVIKLSENDGLLFTPLVPLCRQCDVDIHSDVCNEVRGVELEIVIFCHRTFIRLHVYKDYKQN